MSPSNLTPNVNINNRYVFTIAGTKVEGVGNTAYTAFIDLGHTLEEWNALPADFWDIVEMDTREIHPKAKKSS